MDCKSSKSGGSGGNESSRKGTAVFTGRVIQSPSVIQPIEVNSRIKTLEETMNKFTKFMDFVMGGDTEDMEVVKGVDSEDIKVLKGESSAEMDNCGMEAEEGEIDIKPWKGKGIGKNRGVKRTHEISDSEDEENNVVLTSVGRDSNNNVTEVSVVKGSEVDQKCDMIMNNKTLNQNTQWASRLAKYNVEEKTEKEVGSDLAEFVNKAITTNHRHNDINIE